MSLANRIRARAYYSNPYRHVSSLVPGRIDQGIDMAGYGPVYPIGRAQIVSLDQHNTGWPGGCLIVYELLRGPASGRLVYLAENLTVNPALRVGQVVTRWTPLATLHNASPNSESGWWSALGHALARDDGGYREGQLTRLGLNFARLVSAVGGPMGLTQGRTVAGWLPRGFPAW